MTTRRPRTSLKLKMSISCITRLTMLAEDWPFENVYPPMAEHSPEFDQDFVISVLEEAHDVWKPTRDIQSIREESSAGATEEEDVAPDTERDDSV